MGAGNLSNRRGGRGLMLAAAFGTFVLAGEAPAAAGTCPEGYPEGLPCPMDPAETVLQEHEDRVARLKRLGAGTQNFSFHTSVITPAEHGLAQYPLDMPVLRVVADQDVFFDSGSDSIRPEAMPLLDIVAESLSREPPDVSLFVAGHTDSRGERGYNLNLGERRAQAVAAALVRKGIYQADVFRVSFGEEIPLASNETAEGRARNRRVEFLFAAQPAVVVSELQRQKITLCPKGGKPETDENCLIASNYEARRVSVPLDQQKIVLQLNEEREAIEASTSMTAVKKEQELQRIEMKRERIAITLDMERIPIVFDPSMVTRTAEQ